MNIYVFEDVIFKIYIYFLFVDFGLIVSLVYLIVGDIEILLRTRKAIKLGIVFVIVIVRSLNDIFLGLIFLFINFVVIFLGLVVKVENK